MVGSGASNISFTWQQLADTKEGPMDQWTDGHLHCISGSPSDYPTSALTLLTARSHKSFSAALRAQKR